MIFITTQKHVIDNWESTARSIVLNFKFIDFCFTVITRKRLEGVL